MASQKMKCQSKVKAHFTVLLVKALRATGSRTQTQLQTLSTKESLKKLVTVGKSQRICLL